MIQLSWHRWNWEDSDQGLRFCRGEHHRSDDCEWEYLTAAEVQRFLDETKKALGEGTNSHKAETHLKKPIAAARWQVMIEREEDTVHFGRMDMLSECAKRCEMERPHASQYRIMDAVRASPLFVKGGLVNGYDHRGNPHKLGLHKLKEAK